MLNLPVSPKLAITKKFAFQVSTGLQYRMNAAVLKNWTFRKRCKFRAIKTRGVRQAGYMSWKNHTEFQSKKPQWEMTIW
jgi:hypothetical protein